MPFVYFYRKQTDSHNKTVHDILMKEIPLILPNFPKNKKEKRGIITLLVTGFIGLAYKSISIYLHKKVKQHLKNYTMEVYHSVCDIQARLKVYFLIKQN